MDRSSRSRAAIALSMSATIVVMAVTWGRGQTTAPPTKTDSRINEPFKKPDVKGFIKKFESDDREVFAKRHEIVAALGLRPGMAVADVGAGTRFVYPIIRRQGGEDGTGLRRRCRSQLSWHISPLKPRNTDNTGHDCTGEPVIDQSDSGIC